jgi:ATP-dependent RNA helicase DeaD
MPTKAAGSLEWRTAMTFAEIGVPPALVAALAQQQITQPTAIQAAAFPVLLAGRDAYLHAETGTGKTLAYLLPLFCRIDAQRTAPQVVILAPTHELAIQLQHVCGDLAARAGWPLRSALLIGGSSVPRQLDKLKAKPHLVIGSPGRIRELIVLRKLKTHMVTSIVLEEADRLLVEENLADVRSTIQAARRDRQLILVSATPPPDSAGVIGELTADLVMVQTGSNLVNARIEHLYLLCERRDKPDVLRRLLHALHAERAMVFVHRSETAEIVAAKLRHHQVLVADLHAARDREDRKAAMAGFRTGAVPVLIVSDVAARGLDITGVTHIINFDAPTESKAYLHRVGRTARADASGQAVTLLTEAEARLVPRYEAELGIAMHPVRLREGQLLPDARPAHAG